MSWWVWVLIGIGGYALLLLWVWALCVAAYRGDQVEAQARRLRWARDARGRRGV